MGDDEAAAHHDLRPDQNDSFSRGTLDSLKHNRNITTATLNDLCRIPSCRVEDVLVYIPDETEEP